MKGLLFLILFLNVPCRVAPDSEPDSEDDPFLSLQSDLFAIKTIEPQSYADYEAGRVVKLKLDEYEKYIVRFDPPEHCTKIIICITWDDISCNDANNAILLKPEGEAYEKSMDSTQTFKIKKMFDINEDIIYVSSTNEEVILTLNPRFGKNVWKSALEDQKNNKLRIETNSFYCTVHSGTTGSVKNQVPEMDIAECDSDETKKEVFSMNPFLYYDGSNRKLFGPLFRNFPTGIDGSDVNECKARNIESLLKPEFSIQCPFVQDWFGFSMWSMRPLDVHSGNIWKSPVYHYKLTKISDCIKPSGSILVDSNGDPISTFLKPFQIDVEIGSIFNPIVVDKNSCFGFALVFGEKDLPSEIKPENSFEFYIPSLIMLTPENDKARSLRVERDGLRRIRISFYMKQENTRYTQNFAIVEYAFLNDNIAGVREYVMLKDDSFYSYQSVSLFKHGQCAVRILDVRRVSEFKSPTTPAPTPPDDRSPPESCWEIAGCNVMKLQQ